MSYLKKIPAKRIILTLILVMPIMLLGLTILLISKGYLAVVPKW